MGFSFSKETNISGLGHFITGNYTGDGEVSQAITGLGFSPKMLIIWGVSSFTQFFSCDKDTEGQAIKIYNTSHSTAQNMILSLDSDGFTVSDNNTDAHPNSNGVSYCFIAWG